MQDKAPSTPPQPPAPPRHKARVTPLEGGFKYSASQISTQRDCFTKWYLDQTLGLPRQDTQATLLGKKVHGELEGWLRDRKPPAHPRAKALLPLLPLPSPGLLVEHEFRLLTPPGVVRGFIDLFIPDPAGLDMPVGFEAEAGTPCVLDHKTTSNMFYAKSSRDLVTDPQAVLYGLAARVHQKEKDGPPPGNVDLNWNYVQTRGDPETKAVRLRQSLQMMEDGLGPIIEEAGRMRAALVSETDAADLPHSLGSCEKFGGCQFLELCPHVNKKAFTMTDSIQESSNPPPAPTSSTLARLQRLKEEKRARAAAHAATPPLGSIPIEASTSPMFQRTDITHADGRPLLDPSVPSVTPEPKLEAIPTAAVAPAPVPVEILPPDAPAPKRGRPAKTTRAAVELAAMVSPAADLPLGEDEKALVATIRAAGIKLIQINTLKGDLARVGDLAYMIRSVTEPEAD